MVDIFTTQLAKVYQTPIKPERVKVKALKKEARTKAFNDEEDHLNGEHYLNEALIETLRHQAEHESSPTYDDILKAAQHHHTVENDKSDDDDDSSPHLDIYI